MEAGLSGRLSSVLDVAFFQPRYVFNIVWFSILINIILFIGLYVKALQNKSPLSTEHLCLFLYSTYKLRQPPSH